MGEWPENQWCWSAPFFECVVIPTFTNKNRDSGSGIKAYFHWFGSRGKSSKTIHYCPWPIPLFSAPNKKEGRKKRVNGSWTIWIVFEDSPQSHLKRPGFLKPAPDSGPGPQHWWKGNQGNA